MATLGTSHHQARVQWLKSPSPQDLGRWVLTSICLSGWLAGWQASTALDSRGRASELWHWTCHNLASLSPREEREGDGIRDREELDTKELNLSRIGTAGLYGGEANEWVCCRDSARILPNLRPRIGCHILIPSRCSQRAGLGSPLYRKNNCLTWAI